jgi:tetratricopeptide (TPR) repeat protein
MAWRTTSPAVRTAAILFGTLTLSHALAAGGGAPAWLGEVRQAELAIQREDYVTSAALAAGVLARAESDARSGPAAELDLASVLNILGTSQAGLGRPAQAAPLLARALDIRRRLLPAPHIDLAVSLNNHAGALLLTGEFDAARAAAAESVAMFENLKETSGAEYGLALNNFATARAELGDYVQAVALYDRAHAVLSAVLPPAAPRIVRLLINEGIAVQRTGDLERAAGLFDSALALVRQSAPADPLLLSGALNALGDLRIQQGRPADAERMLTEAYGVAAALDPPLPLKSGVVEASLARACHRRGRLEQAEEHFQSALAALRTVQSLAPVQYASAMNNYGLLLLDMRRLAPAADAFAESKRIFDSKLGPAHPNSIAVVLNLAALAERRHQAGRAAELYQSAVDLDTAHFGRRHYRVALDLNSLGAFEFRRKHLPQAAKLLRESRDILRSTWGPDHPQVALIEANLGLTLWRSKQYDEAEVIMADSIRIQEGLFGPDNPGLVPLYENYAQLLRDNQHFAASEEAKLRAMRIRVRQALGKTTETG